MSFYHTITFTRLVAINLLLPPEPEVPGGRPVPHPLTRKTPEFLKGLSCRFRRIISTDAGGPANFDRITHFRAFVEIVILARILLGVTLFQHSFFLLYMVAYFLKHQHMNSKHTRAVVSRMVEGVDAIVQPPEIPPAFSTVWTMLQDMIGFWSGRTLQGNLRTTDPPPSADGNPKSMMKAKSSAGDTQAEKCQGSLAPDQYEDSIKDFAPCLFDNN